MPLGVEMLRTSYAVQVESAGENKYVSRVKLINYDTGKVFYDKLTFVYIELPNFTKELKDVKTFFEQWVYIIRHLHKLKDMPKKFRNDEIFEKLFEIAKIARMTKKEVDTYLKDLNNMNIVKNEIRARDNIIAQRDNTIAVQGNTIAQQAQRIAELERMAGLKNKD